MREFKVQNIPKPILGNACISFEEFKTGAWDLEIGSGDGEFSLSRALMFPKRQIIAIEKTKNKMKKIKSKAKLPSNLRLFHTNAVWWVSHFLPEESIDCLFILYPNPYPKKKQENMRWVNRPFMRYLLTRLKIKGHLEIRTNEKFYYAELKAKMEKNFPMMKCCQDVELNSTRAETCFERKYKTRGPCWCVKFSRRSK